ncbi:hypothetical protein AJ80_07084 [Polytolypa hystricis UAMH7299]|uniref:Uncharacterized protein n=1 Tax=Polytolypa hystricis (strain UAMH7299) TaxID=1447883 RepID=A0A2B7XSE3_POLH7|nr:hypothetical protein AJ80_07084 [Polytolypa hystricis UAMH7299]
MPAPLAKGIVITVTIIVAAGIAVYESPKVREWVRDSRRKIAVALHSLGDEIHPGQLNPSRREDISMTEDLGEEAEERRRKARDDISRRAALLEAKRRNSSTCSSSFDNLVDRDGRLKHEEEGGEAEGSQGKATGVEIAPSESIHRRHEGVTDISRSISDFAPRMSPEHRQAILENIDRDRMQIVLPSSDVSSNHPSESLVDLTPRSELPESDQALESVSHSQLFPAQSTRSSTHTEDGEPDFYYAHPHQAENTTGTDNQQQNPFGIQSQWTPVSSAPSVASDLSHIHHDPFDHVSNDGTLSEADDLRDAIHTPASWSEVGSVVSSNDGAHR